MRQPTEITIGDTTLDVVLKQHKDWMWGKPEGVRAYLRGADLREANLIEAGLRGADLRGANLIEADLRGANLIEADLREANLIEADLRWANLSDANLREADLCGANLCGADLRGADLCGANLRDADLSRAYLRGAYLRGAKLRGANLRGADLSDADLSGAKLPHFQLPDGDLIGWGKKGGHIVKLRIPADAKRTASLVGRKCRAEWVEVLDIEGADECHSSGGVGSVYRVGETVRPDGYDDDIRIECTHGIHFFQTRQEAE